MLTLLLTALLAGSLSAAEPGTELPPKAKAYVQTVSEVMGKKSSSYRYYILQKPGTIDRFLVHYTPLDKPESVVGVRVFVSYSPEKGVTASIVETWYKVLEKQVLTKSQIAAEMRKTEHPEAFAFVAACALQRECPLTIGFQADRFQDLGDLVTLTFTYEELLKICSK